MAPPNMHLTRRSSQHMVDFFFIEVYKYYAQKHLALTQEIVLPTIVGWLGAFT